MSSRFMLAALGAALALSSAAGPTPIVPPPSTAGTLSSRDQTSSGPYRPPVDAPVIDPFRSPPNPYGAGNRGLDYATTPGQSVVAIGPGIVVFAGVIAGLRFVTVHHADGLRSSYSWLQSIDVRFGQEVAAGQGIGTAGERFQLGIRRGSTYLDPSTLWSNGRRAHLVAG